MLSLYKIWDNTQYIFGLFFLFSLGGFVLVQSKSSEIKTEHYTYQASKIQTGTYNFTGDYSSYNKTRSKKYTKINFSCMLNHLDKTTNTAKERFSDIVILKSVVSENTIKTNIVYTGLKSAPKKEDVATINDAMFYCLNKKEP